MEPGPTRRIDGGHSAGQRRRPLVRDLGRGRARRADPRRRVRPLQLRARRRRSSRSASRSSTSTCAATAQSDRPLQHYDMEVWADDVAGLLDALGIAEAHVHGTSMGGMIAIVFAGKYPERTTSVVINCAAAKLGRSGPARLQELDRHRDAGSRRARQPDPRRADRLAGALEGVPRDPGRRRARSTRSSRSSATRTGSRSSPPRVRRCATWTSAPWLPQDHVARARPRRRRGSDDAVGPGPGGAGQQAICGRHPGRREARDPRLEPLDDLRQHRRAQPRRDRLLHAAQLGARRGRRGRQRPTDA